MENNHKEALESLLESLAKEKEGVINKINGIIDSHAAKFGYTNSVDISNGKSGHNRENKASQNDHSHHSHSEECGCGHQKMQMSTIFERIAIALETIASQEGCKCNCHSDSFVGESEEL